MTSFRSPALSPAGRGISRVQFRTPTQRSLSTTCQPRHYDPYQDMASAISQPHSNHTGFSRWLFAAQTLLPTPVRLRIATRKRQLLLITPIRQHRPYLLPTRSAGLENNMPPIRRPRRKIISTPIMSQLNPLLAGRVHQINIRCPRSTRPVMSSPGEHQKLPIRRPRRRYRITLVGNPLHIGAVRFHGVNLRQPAAPAYPSDLRPSLAIPYR